MSRYKAYPEYKDSGVEWLGCIPKHWLLVPLKYLTSFSGGGTPSKERLEFWGGDIPWVSPKDMKCKRINKTIDNITEAGLKGSTTAIVKPYSLLMVVRSGILQHSIPIAINEVPLSLNQDMKALSFHDANLTEFIFNLISGNQQQLRLAWCKEGATVESIEHEYLANTLIPCPSLKERKLINLFLNHHIGEIDKLIEKQQKLISLLREKRQAVISHAVTKGLNPDVPMRDSGVEWLGMVPAHWIVRRLKHTAALQSGMPKGKDLADRYTISVPMLRVANVQDGYVDLSDVHQINIDPTDLDRYTLKNGDVLMNEGGDNDKLGRGAVWDGGIQPCIHQNHVFAIRPQEIEPEWLDLVTRADYAKFHFFRVAKQSTNLASISSSNIKETPLLIPPEDERRNIMKFVESKLSKFDLLEMQANKQIELFQERRTALISAAVTGKIDVRDWQPPEAAA